VSPYGIGVQPPCGHLSGPGSQCNRSGVEHGVDQQFSMPHVPQQNRVVERKNRTLVEMADLIDYLTLRLTSLLSHMM
jgi:hypothetical protein